MLLDFDKIVEDNPDFNHHIYLNTVGVNVRELFDFVSKGGILEVKHTQENGGNVEVKIERPTAIYFDDEITRYVEFDNATLDFDIILSNKPESGSEIYGVSGLYGGTPTLARTDDAVDMRVFVDDTTGEYVTDFDNVFPFNQIQRVEIENDFGQKNTFVKIPSMWFRIGTDNDQNITDIAVSRKKGKGNNWYQTQEFYYGAYYGSLNGTTLLSQTNATALNNVTISQVREYASANSQEDSTLYKGLDLYHNTIIKFLVWIEFASKLLPVSSEFWTYGDLTGVTDNYNDSISVVDYKYLKWRGIEGLPNYSFIDGVYGNYRIQIDFMTQRILSYSYDGVGQNIRSWGWDSENPFAVMPKVTTDVFDPNQNSDIIDFTNTSDSTIWGSKINGNSYYGSKYHNETTNYKFAGTFCRLIYCPNEATNQNNE